MWLLTRDNSEAITIISIITLEQYWQFAIVTLLVYDTIVTLDREGRPLKKPVNLAYFLNRYIGIIGAILHVLLEGLNININMCEGSVYNKLDSALMNLSDWIAIASIDSKFLSICLMALLGLEVAVKFGIFVYGTWLEQPTPESIAENISVCSAQAQNLTLGIISWYEESDSGPVSVSTSNAGGSENASQV
ncbi:uncharacterized protein FOMMEDRAFT_31162 [Fomitiporia mediterranea MF3/22]|uniref:uncharacterized protein n=1 Tax=Fomitiporia mediterranea (strain MF3/22) TaxID=694068 RepID=UPI0004409404|nr:uncharacterized protein FOMMEDRAFT_31162 [Fomitiporia mediterranea MF3/22]EJC99435.1 hypothetical protein FOMMEDRAFT_31162 [Fomitiporia mediterranea MF3/22]